MFPAADEVLRSPEGSLGEVPLGLLLRALREGERSATLELRRHQVVKRIAFENGVPVGCRSNLLRDTLGHLLVERGRITEAQCHDAVLECVRDDVPLGTVLVRRGLVPPHELFRALQASVAQALLECFGWPDGRYRLEGPTEHEQTALKLNPSQLVYTAALTVVPPELVARALPFGDEARLERVPGTPPVPPGLRLQPRDVRFLNLVARQSVREAAVAAGLSPAEARRRIYAFGLLGLLRLAADQPAPAASAPVEPPLLVPVEEEPPPLVLAAPPPDTAKRIDEVTAAWLAHRAQDPFDLLGISPFASLDEMRAAYLAFAERYRPAAFTGRLEPVADKAEDLFLAGARAWGVLGDYESRNLAIERRKRREAEAKRRKGAPGEAFRIRTDLLDAREQYNTALARLKDGDAAAAVQYLEFTCDIEPRNALYRAWLGWARFHLVPPAADRALADLRDAQKLAPACDAAWYFEGCVQRALGQLDRAEECLSRAELLKPGDRSYQDALKAVRRARQR